MGAKPATLPSPKKAKRAATVISIPKVGNRIYGDDVPMPWREAAQQTGLPARSFYALIERGEIKGQFVGRHLMVRPSEVRIYLKREETRVV